MTNLIVAVSLILTPSPITAPKEAPTSWPTVISAPSPPTITDWSFPPTELQPSLFVETPPAAFTVSSEPSPPLPPPPLLVPIEAGMNRLAELGASPYQLRVFGCLAWFESRNDPYAVSRTNDRGLWQIHFPLHAWRSAGRDIYDPVVNAEVAWDIYRESGWRAWSTHGLCGV